MSLNPLNPASFCSKLDQTAIVDEPFKINDLPKELREMILSKLTPRDLQIAAHTSKEMKIHVLNAASFKEHSSIKKFIEILSRKLDIKIFPEQRKLLVGIAENITLQEFPNLLLLKRYILDVKTQSPISLDSKSHPYASYEYPSSSSSILLTMPSKNL